MSGDKMALAYARARVCREKQAAATQYYAATTDQERAIAEQDFKAAQTRLDALSSLIPKELISSPAWAKIKDT